MKTHHIFFTILAMLFVMGSSTTLRAQCMPNANISPGFTSVFPGGISSFGIVGPNANGDYLIVGNTSVPAIQTILSLLPLPNAVNQQFCDAIPVTFGALYFSYVPTVPERAGNFSAFAAQLTGVPGVINGQFSLGGSFWGWRIPAQLRTSTVVSEDPNFTPAVLAPGLSVPSGVVFRASRGDLVLSQQGNNQISLVNANSGATTSFATQTSPDEIAVRSGDGVVAVKTQVTGQIAGPIDFYSSTGTLLGSIPQGNPNGCITGMAFDASGNLFVAAGPVGAGGPGGCATTGWTLYEFMGSIPWTATPSSVVTFFDGDLIEGVAFNPTPLPSGSLYAVSSTNGNIYQIFLCPACEFVSASLVATVPTTTDINGNPHPGISGITIDPLLGDIYISEFGGTNMLRMPPPQISDPPLTVFATGFRNTFGVSFDSNGNLYVNETNNGNLWKFARNASAAPQQQIVQGQTMTFTNPNPSMSDQVQTIFIPASANPNGAAKISVVFVPTSPDVLNARLTQGSNGDSNFFGGGPIPPGSTCVTVPSTNNNCLVTVQKCFNADGSEQAICTEREPDTSTDLIQLTTSYANPAGAPPAHFAIDFDTPSNNNSATDITTQPLDCCTGKGGTKSLCSQTYFFVPGASASGFRDFSIGPISPLPITVASGGSSSATVPVTSIDSFNSPVALGVSDTPSGVTATLSQSSVTPAADTTDTSTTLTVSVGSSFESATTTPNIATVIANLLASGCIDNSGIGNALTSKLSTAQAAINGGQLQTAINTLTAFKSQVRAQAGKHIGTSCTTTFTLIVSGQAFGVTHLASANVSVTSLNAASILSADASSLISQLSVVTNGDPITGFVLNSGLGVNGATVTIFNGASPVLTATTDMTGFYYFPHTSSLISGVTYTIQITGLAGFTTSTPASQTFTWGGTGMAFSFTLN
jgi:hypothetical protein